MADRVPASQLVSARVCKGERQAVPTFYFRDIQDLFDRHGAL